MNQNNIVICYHEGLNEDISGIKVTIKSLKEHFDSQIIVLYNNVSQKLLNFLKETNTTLVDCSDYKVTYKTSPYNNKIIYTFLFFKNNTELLRDKNILFCDVGDFYFQINPFSLLSDEIVVGLESLNIGECSTNSVWMSICYGVDTLKELSNKTVINSGFIMGSFEKIYDLFQKMIHDLQIILTRINYPTTDQTILNKLIYKDDLKVKIDRENITNMAQKNSDTLNKINHQYNKISNLDLAKKLYKKYE